MSCPRCLFQRVAALAALALVWTLGAAPTAGAAQAPFEDTIAQRTLACAACHGKEGRAGPDGFYPRIAGKPAGYLFNQLLNFRDSRRHYGLMQRMVDPLTDDYLREIAEFFAALDLPYPPALPATAPPALLRRGEELVRRGDTALRVPACMQCHGDKLTGALPAVPGLLGLPLDYLNAQIGAWRTGERKAHAPDCMATLAERLSPADVNAVANWLAAQPVPTDSHPHPALPEAMPLDCGSAAGSAAFDASNRRSVTR